MPAPNETALYGMVTAAYFAIFMYRYNRGHVYTDNRAMMNVGVLFMVAQPLCRIIGGSNGLMIFAFMCMSSVIMLPSPRDVAREQAVEEAAQQERRSVENKKKARGMEKRRKKKD